MSIYQSLKELESRCPVEETIAGHEVYCRVSEIPGLGFGHAFSVDGDDALLTRRQAARILESLDQPEEQP